MAYHCKLYAVQKGLALCKASPGEQADKAKAYLVGELEDLEQMKAAMGGLTDKEDLQAHVENFILSVFAQTDKDERTVATITKKNAVDFKRTGDFIQLLTLFGELDAEWEQRRKYCVYKAGTIMKALKAGEQPPRGNPFAPPEEETQPEEEKKEEMPASMQP